MSRTRVSIVFLVGMGRSGTTLLSRLLDLEPGYRAVGELRYLADPASYQAPCGCGAPQAECAEWKPVADLMADPAKARDWRYAIFAPQRDQLTGLAAPSRPSAGLERALESVRLVYETLARDGSVLVDESKTPWMGYLLSMQPWAEVRFVELVRAPTDVIRSRSTAKGYQPPTPSEVVGKQWLRTCMTTALLRRRTSAPWLRISYSDLVNEPQKVLTQILGHEPQGLRREDGEWVFEAVPTHIFRSNSDKLRRGRDTVRPSTGRPAPLSPEAGRWARLADRYWRRFMAGRVAVARNWSPAVALMPRVAAEHDAAAPVRVAAKL